MKFENLVMKIDDEETTAAIFKYTTSEPAKYLPELETYRMNIINTQSTDLVIDGKTFMASANDPCFTSMTFMCFQHSSGCAPTEPHVATAFCMESNTCSTNYIYVDPGLVCLTGTLNTGGGGAPPSNPAGPSSNNNGNTGASANGGITLSPIGSDPISTQIKTFFRNLSPEVKQCYDSLPNAKKEKLSLFLNSSINNVSDCPNNTDSEPLFNYAENLISSQCDTNAQANWNDFENQFLTASEGIETTGDLNLNDLNLDFQSQNLPTMDAFVAAYPSHLDPLYITSAQIFTAVGGDVLTRYNNGARNSCALRISRGLNYAGITIPNIPGVTTKGSDNKNYILMADNLLSWMKSTFGTPSGSNYLTECDGGLNGVQFKNLINDKQGIYIMIPKDTSANGFDASGHADMLYSNQTCDGGCYFNANGGVKEIFIYELP